MPGLSCISLYFVPAKNRHVGQKADRLREVARRPLSYLKIDFSILKHINFKYYKLAERATVCGPHFEPFKIKHN